MRKSILQNLAILAFALFGLGIIGNNVFADGTQLEHEGVSDGGWVNCRHNDGIGPPFWGRVCGECKVVFRSTFGSKGKCYR